METKRTPGNLVANEGRDGIWFIWNSNGGISTKDLIATCVGRVNSEHRDPQVAAADAAFIVRAWNAHDALVHAIRGTGHLIEEMVDFLLNAPASERRDALINYINETRGLRSDAIAKAECRS